MIGLLSFVAFLATIPAANWLVANVGPIPVGFGLMAPAGVLLVGIALVLRDVVQKELGGIAAIMAIVFGCLLSLALAPPALVIASGAAFLISEFADFAVYTPLRRRGFLLAVVASSLVGLVVDSALFLWLAFGSFEYLAGQVVGKAEMVLGAVIILAALRAISSNSSRVQS